MNKVVLFFLILSIQFDLLSKDPHVSPYLNKKIEQLKKEDKLKELTHEEITKIQKRKYSPKHSSKKKK